MASSDLVLSCSLQKLSGKEYHKVEGRDETTQPQSKDLGGGNSNTISTEKLLDE